MHGLNGLSLAMPFRVTKAGTHEHVGFRMNTETRKWLERADKVISATDPISVAKPKRTLALFVSLLDTAAGSSSAIGRWEILLAENRVDQNIAVIH
jgi:hypothetical protein